MIPRMWLGVITLVCLTGLNAQERILSWHSDIAITPDGSMTITETLRVRAEGVAIQRGIFRDFPTRYRDRMNNNYVVGFDIIDVTRNGVAENWRIENVSNGVRVYIGNADIMIPRGEHEYRLRYRTDRQLGFFTDHDELYWNVTGNGWDFVIERVSADISLPAAVPVSDLNATAYTGPTGATGRDYTAELQSGGVRFTGTAALNPREGLTVVFSWPKGIIEEPTASQRSIWLLSDNAGLLIAVLTLLLTSTYLYRTWARVGKDPKAGVIFPHYAPPGDFSPASLRYISRRGYDMKAFTAAVVNLAVKGYLRIHQDGKKYSLEELDSTQALAPGESAVLRELFRKYSPVTLDNRSHDILSRARGMHRNTLRKEYLNTYFTLNSRQLLPSLLLIPVVFIGLAVLGTLTVLAGILLAVNLLLHGLFLYLLQAPTPRGRELLDQVEGFKLYLEVAEKDDLQLQYQPDMTPELFERYLPFAIALGVEQGWARKFEQSLQTMSATTTAGYHPAWYSGDFSNDHLRDFTQSVGSQFSAAISSAATPPGSTSGASGGSSGGGGGGGGGGGW